MTIWAAALIALIAAWIITGGLALIGAGIPLMREKIRKKRRQGHE